MQCYVIFALAAEVGGMSFKEHKWLNVGCCTRAVSDTKKHKNKTQKCLTI